MKFLSISFILALMSLLPLSAATTEEYGLQVKSLASLDVDPTSLVLENGEPLSLRRKPLELSFGLYNCAERPFGCVLRMISQDGFSIDLMNTVDQHGVYRPQIVAGDINCVIPATIRWDEWVDVRISINPTGGGMLIDYDGISANIDSEQLSEVRSLRFSFGNCPFEGYKVNSVASIAVRDVRIVSDGRLIRHWPLLKHCQNDTFDEVEGVKAVAVNPEWIADRTISLKHLMSSEYDDFVDVVYDGDDLFYFLLPDGTVNVWNVASGAQESIRPRSGISPSNAPNQSKWCNDGRILSYCIAQNRYGVYDLKTNTWNNNRPSDPNAIYWNVTTSWDEMRSRLYSFGGYGFHHFSNILRVFSPDNPESSIAVTLDKIAPRFFASSVVLGDDLYIFGGEGSYSGNQGIVEEYFFDLHRVDLETFQETLVWEASELPFGKFIPGENLVYDEHEKCFYTTAITDRDFVLAKLGFEAPLIEPVSLPAGVRIDANIQYTNLYRNRQGDCMYALFIQTSESGRTKVDIMDIDLPLRPVDEVIVAEGAYEESKDIFSYSNVLVALTLLLFIASVCIFLTYNRKYNAGRRLRNLKDVSELDELYDFSRNSIRIIGGFAVRNRDGEDISSLFSPTLRKLLSALILYTVKFNHGIQGDKLNMLIWGYKPEGTASNNRNVYISRLRAVLEGMDGISISTKNKYLSISMSDEVLCDYRELMGLFEEPESSRDQLRILCLLLRGSLLPNLHDEWVGEFKNDYSSMALTFLNQQIDNDNLSEGVRVRLADTIMMYDKLNERALRIKCSISHADGNIASAKEAYDAFCREYMAVIGEEYAVPFKQIIS